MITFKSSGDFSKTDNFLKKMVKMDLDSVLTDCAQKGVQALEDATPRRTGLTALSWSYEIERTADSITITWTNSNFNKGVPIALMIQYGHGTGTGGYVPGVDYINPAMRPIFEEIEQRVMKEVNAR